MGFARFAELTAIFSLKLQQTSYSICVETEFLNIIQMKFRLQRANPRASASFRWFDDELLCDLWGSIWHRFCEAPGEFSHSSPSINRQCNRWRDLATTLLTNNTHIPAACVLHWKPNCVSFLQQSPNRVLWKPRIPLINVWFRYDSLSA
jgi:hypothetical protein